MPLCVTVEAPAFLEQHFLFFIGEKCCSIVLPLQLLGSPATCPHGVQCVHVHCIVISPPTLPFALQGLLPSVFIMSKEWVGECGLVFRVCCVVRSGRLIPLLQCLWSRVRSFDYCCCQGAFQSSSEHQHCPLCIWFPSCSFA
jgi:hypothetical protein